MKHVLACFVLLLALIGAGSLHAQRNFDNVQIKTIPVAGNVSMLEGSGGNIGVSAGPDGILIIDDQFAGLAEKIRSALEDMKSGTLAFVLNTHWHGDHTGGNPIFGREAPIIAHSNVRTRLRRAWEAQGSPPEGKAGLPVLTFDQSMSLHFNGEEIKLTHFPPGHTDGDSIIYFTESNVLHIGDLFHNGRNPIVDLSSGGDVEGYKRNVGEIIKMFPDDVKIIPGHGPLATLAELKAFHQKLLTEPDFFVVRGTPGGSQR